MNVFINVIAIVLAAALLPAGLVTLYLALLSLAAALNPKRRQIDGTYGGERQAQAHFVILIPAHDEEMLLGSVLQRLDALTYPQTHYDVLVIADNCSDRTADIARENGAAVLERTDPQHRGKGQALNWAMQQHLSAPDRAFDAVVVLDADSILNPDFLWFVNERLQAGDELLQAYYGVLNPMENWRTSLATAALAVFHFLRPLGREKLGLSCGLKGNGMVFSRRLVTTFGYPAFSVVEDVELAMFYLDRGILARFVPGAHVLGQMATSGRDAGTQRARWEGGRAALIRRWAAPLLRRAVTERNAALFDGAMELLIPPLSIMVMLTGLFAVGTWTAALLADRGLLNGLAVAWLAVLLLQAAYVILGMALARLPPRIFLRLLFAPGFLAWKILTYASMLAARRGRDGDEWVRTERQQTDTTDGDKS